MQSEDEEPTTTNLGSVEGNSSANEPNDEKRFWCCCSMKSIWYPPGGNFLWNLGTDEAPLDIIGESSYRFFLFANMWTFGLAISIVAFQVALFYILWKDTESLPQQEVTSSWDRWIGILCASFVLALKLLPEFGKGMELMWHGMQHLCCPPANKRIHSPKRLVLLVFVGLVIFGVAALCVWVGIVSSLKQSNVSAIITRASIATWIEGMDEYMYSFLRYFSEPAWYNYAMDWLERHYGENKKKQEKRQLTDSEVATLKQMLQKMEC